MLFRRHAALQFFKPVLDDVDLVARCGLLLLGSDHEEALPVRADGIIGAEAAGRLTTRFEKHPWLASAEGGLGLNVHSHHRFIPRVRKSRPLDLSTRRVATPRPSPSQRAEARARARV